MAIFSDITDTVTMEVSIKNFVKKLCHLESSLNEEDLYKCCQVLDKDSCGHISLDDFLEFFGSVQKANQDMKSAEDELEDEMWPDWLIKEGKL
jgi:Ca2+-binding EF-hand superfamily protein